MHTQNARLKGYKEGPRQGTLNLVPLYSPYIYIYTAPGVNPAPAFWHFYSARDVASLVHVDTLQGRRVYLLFQCCGAVHKNTQETKTTKTKKTKTKKTKKTKKTIIQEVSL